jgi:hypothetical protein
MVISKELEHINICIYIYIYICISRYHPHQEVPLQGLLSTYGDENIYLNKLSIQPQNGVDIEIGTFALSSYILQI